MNRLERFGEMEIPVFGTWVLRGSLILQFLRFAIVGAAAAAIYAVAAIIFVEALGLEATLSSALAYTIAVPFSFLGQKFFAFRSTDSISVELPKFFFVHVIMLGLTSAIVWVTDNILALQPVYGVIGVVLLIPILSFLAQKLFVFIAVRH